jgi:hypothetical protein
MPEMERNLISSQLSRAVDAYKEYMSGLGVRDELDTHHALAVDIAIEEGRVGKEEGKLLFSTRLLVTLAQLKKQQVLDLDCRSAHLCANALHDALQVDPCYTFTFKQLHLRFVQEYLRQASGVCEHLALQDFMSTRLLHAFHTIDRSRAPCRQEYVLTRLAIYRARLSRQFEEEKAKLFAATEREANCFGKWCCARSRFHGHLPVLSVSMITYLSSLFP